MPKVFSNAKRFIDFIYTNRDRAEKISDKNAVAIERMSLGLSEAHTLEDSKQLRIAAAMNIADMAIEEAARGEPSDDTLPLRRKVLHALSDIKKLVLDGWQQRSDGFYYKKIENVENYSKIAKVMHWLMATRDYGIRSSKLTAFRWSKIHKSA